MHCPRREIFWPAGRILNLAWDVKFRSLDGKPIAYISKRPISKKPRSLPIKVENFSENVASKY